MSQIEEAIQRHFETCAEELPKKFVPWTWVVLLFAGTITVIAGATAYTVKGIQDANSKASFSLEQDIRQDREIDRLKDIEQNIQWMRQNWPSQPHR